MTSFAATLSLRRLPAAVLVGCLLAVPSAATPLAAQSAALAASPGAPRELHIVILEGEDALNNLRQRTAREPIVQVQDENHKPVAGAAILFAIHGSSSGAGGTFAGATTLSVHTDAAGQAVATGFHPNSVSGKYEIEVLATVGALTATILMHEQNVTPAEMNASKVTHGIPKKTWITGGTIAVGVGTVIAFAVVNGNHGATITPGAGGVNHP